MWTRSVEDSSTDANTNMYKYILPSVDQVSGGHHYTPIWFNPQVCTNSKYKYKYNCNYNYKYKYK